MQVGQLVNIANKTPTVGGEKIVISTNKVFMRMDGAEMVTGKIGKKRERRVLAEEGRLRQQISLGDLQQFVEINQTDQEESPTFESVQESSPCQMPPHPKGCLVPVTGTPPTCHQGELG